MYFLDIVNIQVKLGPISWANILWYLVVSCGMGFYYFYPVKIKIVRHVQL